MIYLLGDVCPQWNQRGLVVSFIAKENIKRGAVELTSTGWKPEVWPPAIGKHGAANVDCVTD